MSWTRIRNKFAFRFGRARFERELAEEMEIHRQMLEEDAARRGFTGKEARMNAQQRMGNVTLAAEDSRQTWLVRWLDAFLQDARYSLRMLARNPAFASIALLSLALGIGANTAIFRLTDTVLLRSLPVRNPEELVVIRGGFSYPRFEEFRRRQQVLTEIFAAHTLRNLHLSLDGKELGVVSGELVSGNYFSLLGVGTAIGRPLGGEDDRVPEESPVVVISHGLWKRGFAMSPDVLGRKLTVQPGGFSSGAGTGGFEDDAAVRHRQGGVVLTIIGVAPPEFFGDAVGTSVDLWTPMMMQPPLMPGRAWLTRKTASWVSIMGRRRAGVSEDAARNALNMVWRQIRTDEVGAALSEQQKRNIANSRLIVESGEKGFGQLRREFSQPLQILTAVVGLVLLMACLNIANLLLARAAARSHEVTVRLSLGAGRSRLVRQLLTESLLLAGMGGLLGVLLAPAAVRLLVKMVASESRPIVVPFAADWRTLGFTAGISLLSGILFGLAPALRGTRGLHSSIRNAARVTAGGPRNRAAKALVAVQVAVSLMLLVGAGLFLRTLYNLQAQDVGYKREGLLLMRVDPVGAGYRGDDIGRACTNLMDRLAGLPGVATVTFSENGLFSGTESGTPVNVPGFTPASNDDRGARFDQVGPGYFTNVGIPLLLGRDMSERDQPGAPRVAVINETMARFFFKDENPIGKHFRVSRFSDDIEIVGVARDAQDHSFRSQPVRRFYVSYLQPIDGITTANFEIRVHGNAGAVGTAVREAVRGFNRNLNIIDLNGVQTLMDQSIVRERLVARLSAFFGGLAMLLAAIGLYGVMSYTVARRTNEIGIRMALGAQRSHVSGMIAREITVVVVGGAVVGALAALSVTKFVATLIFGLKPNDPTTFLAAGGLLLIVGLLAGYLPARRAARVDPMVALRYE